MGMVGWAEVGFGDHRTFPTLMIYETLQQSLQFGLVPKHLSFLTDEYRKQIKRRQTKEFLPLAASGTSVCNI